MLNFWYWLAGFYEGEGSCGCYLHSRKKKRWRLSVTVSQKDPRVLRLIQKTVGRGNIAKNNGSWGKVYHWRLNCADARWFLNKIKPLMRAPKKIKQLIKALALDKKHVGPRHTRRDPKTGQLIRRK